MLFLSLKYTEKALRNVVRCLLTMDDSTTFLIELKFYLASVIV